MDERKIILIGGGPGSGKSRFGESAVKNLQPDMAAEHFALGDTIRQIALGAIKSAHTEHIRHHLLSERTFDPLDDEIVYDTVDDRLSFYEEAALLLVNGFPRYQPQVDMAYKLATLHERDIAGLLITKTSDLVAIHRLITRSPRDLQPQLMVSHAKDRIAMHASHYPDVVEELRAIRDLPVQTIDSTGDVTYTDTIGQRAINQMLHSPSPPQKNNPT